MIKSEFRTTSTIKEMIKEKSYNMDFIEYKEEKQALQNHVRTRVSTRCKDNGEGYKSPRNYQVNNNIK